MLTKRPSAVFNTGLYLIPYAVIDASAFTMCFVPLRSIPPMYWESTNFLLVTGLK